MFTQMLIGCRLCISTEPQRSYFSLESPQEFLNVKNALSLEADFKQLNIYPNHICQNCKELLSKLQELKTIAHINELFILQCQETIWNYGLEEAKEFYEKSLSSAKDEDNFIEDLQNFSTLTKDITENQTVENMNDLGKDNYGFMKSEVFNENGTDANKGFVESHQQLENSPVSYFNEGQESMQKPFKSDMQTQSKHTPAIKRCPKCRKSFIRDVISKHMRTEHSTEKNQCSHEEGDWQCKKVFKRRGDLTTHMNQIHSKITVVCPDCGKVMKKHLLKDHEIKSHPNEEQTAASTCTVCKKVFYGKQGLAMHMAGRHGPGFSKQQCPECGVEVKFLDLHIKVQHTEDGNKKKIQCTFDGCQSMFRVRQCMLQHFKLVHTDEREQCTICGEWLKCLGDHMRTVHKTGKPFPCDKCGKVFYNTYDRRVHVDRIHEGIKYICPKCGQNYQRIKDHMKSAHQINDIDIRQIQVVKTK